ncbi:MAG: four helix bundle protein [Bacteroidales bacterium]
MNSREIEERLINFAAQIIEICEGLSISHAGSILSHQLVKSETSSALNYGEARGAESRKDFLHKTKVVLKELRETLVGLKIINKTNLCKSEQTLNLALRENEELVSIFVSSTKTMQKNNNR